MIHRLAKDDRLEGALRAGLRAGPCSGIVSAPNQTQFRETYTWIPFLLPNHLLPSCAPLTSINIDAQWRFVMTEKYARNPQTGDIQKDWLGGPQNGNETPSEATQTGTQAKGMGSDGAKVPPSKFWLGGPQNGNETPIEAIPSRSDDELYGVEIRFNNNTSSDLKLLASTKTDGWDDLTSELPAGISYGFAVVFGQRLGGVYSLGEGDVFTIAATCSDDGMTYNCIADASGSFVVTSSNCMSPWPPLPEIVLTLEPK